MKLPGWEIIDEGVTPEAAIAWWKQRANLTDAEAGALTEGAKQRAFYVTGLARRDLVRLVSDGIRAALENGETLESFRERITEAIHAEGWRDRRVELIFRTNMQTAYAAGRWKKIQAVKAYRPYLQYVARMVRTRPSHAILHRLVYPADHEFWKTNYPPNGFRCHCHVVTLSSRQVEQRGLTVQKEMPKPGVWKDPKTGMEYSVNFPGADKGFRGNPGKDWLDGLDLKKYPDLNGKSYEEQRGPASRRPAPVKTYAELAEGIKQRCGQFATNNGIKRVVTENGRGYFMATDSRGTLWLNSKTFPTSCDGFNALRDLKNAWNKLAKGEELTFNEEYAFESLWHELTHNRQKPGNLGEKDSPQRRIMEIFTQWTARRTYPRLLESLGGKAAHQKEILKKGYGYGRRIQNFDRLLEVLKIKDEDLSPEMLRLMDTVSTADYDGELKELLAQMSGREFLNIAHVLDEIDAFDFEEQLRIAEFI